MSLKESYTYTSQRLSKANALWVNIRSEEGYRVRRANENTSAVPPVRLPVRANIMWSVSFFTVVEGVKVSSDPLGAVTHGMAFQAQRRRNPLAQEAWPFSPDTRPASIAPVVLFRRDTLCYRAKKYL